MVTGRRNKLRRGSVPSRGQPGKRPLRPGSEWDSAWVEWAEGEMWGSYWGHGLEAGSVGRCWAAGRRARDCPEPSSVSQGRAGQTTFGGEAGGQEGCL